MPLTNYIIPALLRLLILRLPKFGLAAFRDSSSYFPRNSYKPLAHLTAWCISHNIIIWGSLEPNLSEYIPKSFVEVCNLALFYWVIKIRSPVPIFLSVYTDGDSIISSRNLNVSLIRACFYLLCLINYCEALLNKDSIRQIGNG